MNIFMIFLIWLCISQLANSLHAQNENIHDSWAVIVCTSRYWFNYRHLSNALTVYWTIRHLGIPDNRIILMNAHADALSDPRNSFRGIISRSAERLNTSDPISDLAIDAKFDYLGDEVNADSLRGVLTGRYKRFTPESKKLNLNVNSSVLIFMTGHGGDEFFKFHDNEEISAVEIGHIFDEMEIKQRFKSVLFMIETCQAASLSRFVAAANVMTLASSAVGENSYSYHSNSELGVSVIDRFSFALAQCLASDVSSAIKQRPRSPLQPSRLTSSTARDSSKDKMKTVSDFARCFDPRFMRSSPTLSVSASDSAGLVRQAVLHYFSGSMKVAPGSARGSGHSILKDHPYSDDSQLFDQHDIDSAFRHYNDEE